MRFFYRIRIYFLWKKVEKLTEGRGGKFVQARSAVKEIYELSKRRQMTPEDFARYAEAMAELGWLLQL